MLRVTSATKLAAGSVLGTFDFNPWLQSIGSTFGASTVSTSTEIDIAHTVALGVVSVIVGGGQPGVTYRITITCTSANGLTDARTFEVANAGVQPQGSDDIVSIGQKAQQALDAVSAAVDTAGAAHDAATDAATVAANAATAAQQAVQAASDATAAAGSAHDAATAAAGVAAGAASAAANAVPTARTINGKPLSANVSINKTDVGLGNVSNTADADKPVSTAQQQALDLKASQGAVDTLTQTVNGKADLSGLSDLFTATRGVADGVAALAAGVASGKSGFQFQDQTYSHPVSAGGGFVMTSRKTLRGYGGKQTIFKNPDGTNLPGYMWVMPDGTTQVLLEDLVFDCNARGQTSPSVNLGAFAGVTLGAQTFVMLRRLDFLDGKGALHPFISINGGNWTLDEVNMIGHTGAMIHMGGETVTQCVTIKGGLLRDYCQGGGDTTAIRMYPGCQGLVIDDLDVQPLTAGSFWIESPPGGPAGISGLTPQLLKITNCHGDGNNHGGLGVSTSVNKMIALGNTFIRGGRLYSFESSGYDCHLAHNIMDECLLWHNGGRAPNGVDAGTGGRSIIAFNNLTFSSAPARDGVLGAIQTRAQQYTKVVHNIVDLSQVPQGQSMYGISVGANVAPDNNTHDINVDDNILIRGTNGDTVAAIKIDLKVAGHRGTIRGNKFVGWWWPIYPSQGAGDDWVIERNDFSQCLQTPAAVANLSEYRRVIADSNDGAVSFGARLRIGPGNILPGGAPWDSNSRNGFGGLGDTYTANAMGRPLHRIELTGSSGTIAAPTNAYEGARIGFMFVQSGDASVKTVAFDAAFRNFTFSTAGASSGLQIVLWFVCTQKNVAAPTWILDNSPSWH